MASGAVRGLADRPLPVPEILESSLGKTSRSASSYGGDVFVEKEMDAFVFCFFFLTPNTLFPHRFFNFLTSAQRPALPFRSDADCLVRAQTPQGKGPQDHPPLRTRATNGPRAYFCRPAAHKFVGSHNNPLPRKVDNSLD